MIRSLLSQSGGLVLPLGILVMVAMMVLPLPTALLDTFFVGNIVLSLLILLVAMHSLKPLDFSSFPSLLLIATVLRLALNVASTRIVLAEGHTGPDAAGQVIQAFGEFVIAGNFVVGLFVFAILVIINLVVITKGAGRVSEVSARFTLDAMPGKQMAIDADLNAGILSPEAARARRAEVAAEADFYGSMDGASKFVKGDALAGILILVINIVGGILIGVAQHGLALGEAAKVYLLLSVGDGLVAQVPSLLLAIATAIIVTRVSSEADMAGQIAGQVGMARAWVSVAVVMAVLGLVPGMPNLLLLAFAALSAGVAWVTRPRAAAPEPVAPPAETRSPEAILPEDVTDYTPVSLQIGYGLIGLVEKGGGLVSRITAVRRDASRELGFVVPGVRIRDELSLRPNQYRIRIGQAIVGEDEIHPERKLAIPGAASRRRLKGIEVKDPSFGLDAVWILPHQAAEAEADAQVVVEPDSVLATHLAQVFTRHAAALIGPDDVQGLLDQLARHAPTLVAGVVPKLVPLHLLTAVLQRLLADRFPVSDMRRILEGLSMHAGATQSPLDLAEALRPALAGQMLQQIAPLSQALAVILLAPELEQMLLRSLRPGAEGQLMIEPQLAARLAGSVSEAMDRASAEGRQAVVLVAGPLRRALAGFLRANLPEAVVLAVHELPEARRIEVIATVGGKVAEAVP